MSTISKINFPALVIDGSGQSVATGILDESSHWLSRADETGAPLEHLFPAVQTALKAAELRLEEIRTFIYCKGPGSVLGIRLCAMAIETWQRLHSKERPLLLGYNSMAFTAALLEKDRCLDQALLVSDWKKGVWHAIEFDRGKAGDLKTIRDEALQFWENTLYYLPQRKGWQTPPEKSIHLEYAPQRLNEVLSLNGLVELTSKVELYHSGGPNFQKWTAQRHRA